MPFGEKLLLFKNSVLLITRFLPFLPTQNHTVGLVIPWGSKPHDEDLRPAQQELKKYPGLLYYATGTPEDELRLQPTDKHHLSASR